MLDIFHRLFIDVGRVFLPNMMWLF